MGSFAGKSRGLDLLRCWWIALFVVVLATGALLSCSSIRYVSQSLSGGAKVLLQRKPIERLLAREDLEPDLRDRLELVLVLREFAEQRLLLPVGKSYGTYVEVGQPYVAWNVVAAPIHSVVPKTWCFPIAGCVSYRGYFSEEKANRFAEALEDDGWDVSVGGVTAYSTLGWFADPVLDTFVRLSDLSLAGLLFHELAHRRLYVPGDTAFNESFATQVERIGERFYLEGLEDGHELAAAAEVARRRETEFLDLVLGTQACLRTLFESGDSETVMESGKAGEFSLLVERYGALKERWHESEELGPVYDGWFERDLNNAHLAAVGDYSIWLDAFAQLEREAGSLEEFYRLAEELAGLGYDKRQVRLEELSPARVRPPYLCESV